MNSELDDYRPVRYADGMIAGARYANGGEASRPCPNAFPGARRSAGSKRGWAMKSLRRYRGWLLPSAPRIGVIQLATGAATVIAPFSGVLWYWWLVALLFWGEGWHNNHHARPGDWNFRKRWWEFDIGAMVIVAMGLRPARAGGNINHSDT